jgi:hypothetical protein
MAQGKQIFTLGAAAKLVGIKGFTRNVLIRYLKYHGIFNKYGGPTYEYEQYFFWEKLWDIKEPRLMISRYGMEWIKEEQIDKMIDWYNERFLKGRAF